MYLSNFLIHVLSCVCFIDRVAAADPGESNQVKRVPRPRPWIYKRTDRVEKINAYVKELSSALYAVHLAQNAEDIAQWCDPSRIPSFDAMGYDGDYVEAWVCAAAAGDELFPPRTLDQASSNLNIATEGLKQSRDNPGGPARAVYCSFLDIGTLMQAQLNAKDILNHICYPDTGNATWSGTATGTASGTARSTATGTDSSTASMPTSATTSGNSTVPPTGSMTLPPCWTGGATTGGYGCGSTMNTSWTTPTTPPTYGYGRHWK
ncbi:hypothetical protein B0A48_13566 [Cryoendolithus antarcticus]|uniref:Uncharacterized protein n=1 Tax=Cryoendolithus antarcticus TaxID=1507870 RepID=A0A1V8SP54_9PEZI|nr:hypothetical protein B0A48_13566 [Cryoendolithus antarcticus]